MTFGLNEEDAGVSFILLHEIKYFNNEKNYIVTGIYYEEIFDLIKIDLFCHIIIDFVDKLCFKKHKYQ